MIVSMAFSLAPISSLVVLADTAPQSASDYTVLAPLPCIPTPQRTASDGTTIPAVICKSGDLQNVPTVTFQTYVQYAINLLIAMSAVVAVFMIVWGGFEYMTSVSVTGKSGGLDRAKNAVYGLLLVLCSYLILRTIDPRLVDIPSTLVPKIDLKCPTDATKLLSDKTCVTSDVANMQSITQTIAVNYVTNRQSVAQDMVQLKNQVSQAQTQLDGLDQQLNALYDDPNTDQSIINKLEAQRDSIAQTVSDTQNQLTVDRAKLDFNAKIGDVANETSKPEYTASEEITMINQSLDALNKTQANYDAALTKNGGGDSISVVDDNANYARDVLNLMKVDVAVKRSTFYYPTDLQAQIDAVKASASSINDPALKADLQAKIQTIQSGLSI